MANGDRLLDADGNVMLDVDGNVVLSNDAGDDCCCGPTCPTQQEECEHCGNMPVTYKVVVTDVDTCPECIEMVSGFPQWEVTGTINRTYYISVNPDAPCGLYGNFYTAESGSAAADPLSQIRWYDGIDGTTCTGTSYPMDFYDVRIDLTSPTTADATSEGYRRVAVPLEPSLGPYMFSGSNAVTDFCDAETENTIDNDQLACSTLQIGGINGQITVTPCPDPAIVCGQYDCAQVEITGSCPSCVVTGGEYAYSASSGDWAGQDIGVFPGWQPAGYVWIYEKLISGLDYELLYIWFDGADWRCILTTLISGVQSPWFMDIDAQTLTCTDGKLTGTLTLRDYEYSAFGTAVGDCYDCTVTVTFGACYEDELCGSFECDTGDLCIVVTDSGGCDGNHTVTNSSPGTSCGWQSGEYQIGCIDEVDLGEGTVPYNGWSLLTACGVFVKPRTSNNPVGGGWTLISGIGTVTVTSGAC